jgi:hypothetical protein
LEYCLLLLALDKLHSQRTTAQRRASVSLYNSFGHELQSQIYQARRRAGPAQQERGTGTRWGQLAKGCREGGGGKAAACAHWQARALLLKEWEVCERETNASGGRMRSCRSVTACCCTCQLTAPHQKAVTHCQQVQGREEREREIMRGREREREGGRAGGR